MNPHDKESKPMDVVTPDEQQPTQEETTAQNPVEESNGLEFFANDTETRLVAIYRPGARAISITEEEVRAQISDLGFDEEHYPLYQDRLRDLVQGIQQRRHFEIEIGGPIDAEVGVFLSYDQTLAGIQITPPLGRGLPASKEMLINALKKSRIKHGIDQELLNKLFAKGPTLHLKETRCYIIAHGKKAIDGKDAELEPLVEQMSERRPQLLKNSKDQVDFRELGDFPVYEADTPLFRISEPVPGENGITVVGKPIKAYNGKEKKIKINKSIQTDPADTRKYSSAIKGLPVFTDYGVHVDNVLQLDEVNIASGNIRFDGSVQVKKGVNPGMHLEATGDIKIGGLVDNATVIAGGSIDIGGGIMGQKSPELAAESPTKENAVVRAKGNINARFIQDAWVESNAHISAQRLIMHSRLWASNSVKLAAMGQLVGGHVIATDYIEAGQIGVPASVPTLLEVGPLDNVRDEMAQVQEKIKEGFDQAKQLKALIHRIREEKRRISPEKKEQILKARDTINQALKDLEQRRQELEEESQARKKARVKALKKAYSGCNIVIANIGRVLKEDFGKTTFYLDAGEITIR